MRSYFYVLVTARPANEPGGAPLLSTQHTILRAETADTARDFGRRRFRYYGTPAAGATVDEIVQLLPVLSKK